MIDPFLIEGLLGRSNMFILFIHVRSPLFLALLNSREEG